MVAKFCTHGCNFLHAWLHFTFLPYDFTSVDDVDAGDFEDVDGSGVALLYIRKNDNMPAAVLSVGNDVTFVATLLHQLLQGRTVNAGYALKLCIGGGGVYLQFS